MRLACGEMLGSRRVEGTGAGKRAGWAGCGAGVPQPVFFRAGL